MKKNKKPTTQVVSSGLNDVNTSLRLLRLPNGPLALLVFGPDKSKREKAANRACKMLRQGGGDPNTKIKIFDKLKDSLLMLRLDELPEVRVTVKGGVVVDTDSSDALYLTVKDDDCGESTRQCL